MDRDFKKSDFRQGGSEEGDPDAPGMPAACYKLSSSLTKKNPEQAGALRDWLALYTVPQCGFVTISKLLNVFSTPHAVLSASPQALAEAGFTRLLIAGLKNPDWKRVDAALAWREKSGCHHILHWQDPRYPELLRAISSPPPILFVQGKLACLRAPQVAIVGARRPSPMGFEIASRFAGELSRQGLIITSGLALGIDGASHQGCLNAQGVSIAVLGSGMDKLYPRCHQRLALQIVETGGALVCEFFPDSPPRPEHFPRRNRIISGLSVGVVVIEAALRSGSLITAHHAAQEGREVFAVPGSLYNPLSQGCHALLKQGATLVENSQDILLGLALAKGLLNLAKHAPEDKLDLADGPELISALDPEDIKLVECLGFETTSLDNLSIRTGFAVEKLLARLALLELQGYISAVPGGYVRKKYGKKSIDC